LEAFSNKSGITRVSRLVFESHFVMASSQNLQSREIKAKIFATFLPHFEFLRDAGCPVASFPAYLLYTS